MGQIWRFAKQQRSHSRILDGWSQFQKHSRSAHTVVSCNCCFGKVMVIVNPWNTHFHQSLLSLPKRPKTRFSGWVSGRETWMRRFAVRGGEQNKSERRRSFLTLEEAGLVEISGLSTHERFLCRLTISSLNLLRVISEQEGVPIEELNAGRVCDWFLKDKLKGEQNPDTAVLQWDDPDFQIDFRRFLLSICHDSCPTCNHQLELEELPMVMEVWK